ncbi:winged helix DNA-binding domain-containing protein [Leifsonia bigeumensis]|uniref:Winged helix DNA-binding domain-containing protein n=1 Tax=Leifsonella bigeumensis TaxID=433643 RepID=A0ABP7FS18_9MICO
MQVSWRDVTARRLSRHGLSRPLPDVVSAVSAMVGAHAQVMSAAELAVGIRTRGAAASDLAAAIRRDGLLVKTFGPRGTVHLLPASELGEWLGALRALPVSTGQPEGVRLEPGQLDEVLAAVADALGAIPAGADGTGLTTDELDNAVLSRLGPWAGERTVPAFGGWSPRWRQAIIPAAHAGILVFGANRGTRVTYLPAPDFEPVPDADLRLLRRYLHSYGPAMPGDYARWLAIRVGRAQELFARAALDHAGLDRVDLLGRESWVNAGDTAFGNDSLPDLRLLPYFDPYVVGSWPREKLFPGRAWDRALAGGQAGNYPVLLLGGIAGGIWHLKRRARRATMTVEPFSTLSQRRRVALEAEAHRVGRIVGAEIELVLGEVPVGPHA